MKVDYCIAGLGNPGKRYLNTRHNIGFKVIDRLKEFFKINSSLSENNYQFVTAEYESKIIMLIQPLTYMNSSGTALKEFTEKNKIPLENILIVYDDVNLDFGTIRIRPSGSDGGQKGMHSIIYEIQSENIPRLRIGIRNLAELEKFRIVSNYNLADYVLSEFTADERTSLDKILDASRDAVLCFIEYGIKDAMNKFNRNILDKSFS
ncbi:MAG: aminoacyl-tRNA hydrolase [Ignavibacteria bacterium]